MKIRWLFLTGAVIAAWVTLPCALTAQFGRADAEAALTRTVEYVLSQKPDGEYSNPVLVSAGVDEDLALELGIGPADLTGRVSASTQIPVWDGVKFCDTSMNPPHWRMQHADFRLTPTLTYVSGDTARVSVALSGSSSLGGTMVRNLELVRLGDEWTATGYVGVTMHAASAPCGTSRDRYGIYSAIAEDLLEPSWVQTVAIARATSAPSGLGSSTRAHLKREVTTLPDVLLDQFAETGGERLLLSDSFRIDGSYVLLDESWESEFELSHDRAWSLLRERYGDSTAVVVFSRPAVAPDGETALVHYRFICGANLCEEWHYAFLRRRGNAWEIEADVLTLIS